MPVETMISNAAWPTLNESHGNVIPAVESTNGNANANEWEMIADTEEADILHGTTGHVVILPTDDVPNEAKGRPRSATVGGEGAAVSVGSKKVLKESGSFNSSSKSSDPFKVNRRTLRRCASTPDLLVSDKDHEVIVEDESDEEDDEEMEVFSSEECDFCDDEEDEGSVEDETVEEDVVRVQKTQEGGNGDDSFEVVSAKYNGGETEDISTEPVMVDEDASMDTSAWTLTSAAAGAHPVIASVWGGKNTPSFKDILSKNVDKTMSWGDDKAQTEAMLRDSHRRHHLRVRTKPKFIVADDGNSGGKMMKHAHSTGDLTKMMHAPEQVHQPAFGRGMKKQFSALMEEEDEGDFVIGNGGGSGGGRSGGGGMGATEVLGETDAMDYYHRKEKGSQSTINKKKERPDEIKRKEISMYKKELQKEKQQSRSGGGAKKKTNDKGFGGKKERQRW